VHARSPPTARRDTRANPLPPTEDRQEPARPCLARATRIVALASPAIRGCSAQVRGLNCCRRPAHRRPKTGAHAAPVFRNGTLRASRLRIAARDSPARSSPACEPFLAERTRTPVRLPMRPSAPFRAARLPCLPARRAKRAALAPRSRGIIAWRKKQVRAASIRIAHQTGRAGAKPAAYCISLPGAMPGARCTAARPTRT